MLIKYKILLKIVNFYILQLVTWNKYFINCHKFRSSCVSGLIISGFFSYQNFIIVQKIDLVILVICGTMARIAGLFFARASKTLESSLFAPIQYI